MIGDVSENARRDGRSWSVGGEEKDEKQDGKWLDEGRNETNGIVDETFRTHRQNSIRF